jgi:enoyl-CoA hydratase/carnithine racemase
MNQVLLTRPEPGVATLCINRPDVRNALNQAVRQELAGHFAALGEDPDVRCIILTGGDKFFAAGADLRDIAEATPIEMHLRQVQRLWQAIAGCPKPVIAAVNGYAWGGGCELTRAIGKFHAMKMLLTGQPLSGREAFAAGLASEVVEDEKVQERALELARTIAAMPPLAAAQIKEVVLAGQDASLDAALMLERKAFHLLFASEDQKEGMRAFFEKRKPSYEGK